MNSPIIFIQAAARLFISLLFALLLTMQAARADDVIVLTDNFDALLAGRLYKATMQMVKSAPYGHRITVISGGSRPYLIFDYTKMPFVNDNDRVSQLGPIVTALQAFLRQTVARSKNGPIHGGLDVPQIVAKLSREGFGKDRLILIGNPVWMHNQDHAFLLDTETERDLRWRRPTHAHFAADPLLSPFTVPQEPLPGLPVLWWNPVADKSGPVEYLPVLEEFWALYLKNAGGRLAPIVTDEAALYAAMSETPQKFVTAQVNAEEVNAAPAMITLAELKKRAAEAKKPEPAPVAEAQPVPPVDTPVKRIPTTEHTVFVVDRSGSMSGYLNEIAKRLAAQNENPKNRYSLILLAAESEANCGASFTYNSAAALCAAFNQLPHSAGIDSADALSMALIAASTLLNDYKVTGARVLIYADAAPFESPERPANQTYKAVFKQLLAEGHKPTFVRCDPQLSVEWLPQEVELLEF